MKSLYVKLAAIIVVIVVVLSYVGFSSGFSHNSNLYTDTDTGFSIELPREWGVASKELGDNVSSTWFTNASSTGATSTIQLAIERFKRTPEMNKTIKAFGTGPFTQGLVESLWVDLGLDIKKNEVVKIGGESFVHIHSTYVGADTKKEVTQHIYFVFTDEYYYRIGVDAYTESWSQHEDAILAAVQTFELLE